MTHEYTEVDKIAKHSLRILQDLGFDLKIGSKVLDLGCGNGKLVQVFRNLKFDARGADISENFLEIQEVIRKENEDEDIFRKIETQPYRIPYEENTFDFVITSEVLEHVQDHREVFSEIYRILKPGGISLNIFPPRYTPLEVHTHVPLATIFQGYPYLLIWAFLGIRNEYQQDEPFRSVARINHNWLIHHTKYLRKSELKKYALQTFGNADFAEDVYLKVSPGRPGKYYFLAKLFPFLPALYGHLRKRILVLRKIASKESETATGTKQ